jgi:hypothetical protein
MPIELPTLTRRSFLSAAAAGIVSSPIWAKSTTARVSDYRAIDTLRSLQAERREREEGYTVSGGEGLAVLQNRPGMPRRRFSKRSY